MPFESLPPMMAIGLNVLAWFLIHIIAGYAGARMPRYCFAKDAGIYRTRSWEKNGQFYQQVFRIKRWKRYLPDCGEAFGQKASKKAIQSKSISYLESFIMETRRAEWTHWIQIGISPIFFFFNTWPVGCVMLIYAVAANLPCIMAQRFNRPRLMKIAAAKRART